MRIRERELLESREKRGPLITYNFCVPPGMMHEIDRLIITGLFVNRSEVFRYAIMRLIEEFKEV